MKFNDPIEQNLIRIFGKDNISYSKISQKEFDKIFENRIIAGKQFLWNYNPDLLSRKRKKRVINR